MTVATASELMETGTGPRAEQPSPHAARRRVPWTRIFAGEAEQISEARHWIQRLLPVCGALDDVTVLVSELATNAIKHTGSGLPGGWFRIDVTWAETFVRVVVTDHGSDSEPVVRDTGTGADDSPDGGETPDGEDPDGEYGWTAYEDPGGRGLAMVERLADAWGTGGDHLGRFVWFDARWPEDALPLPPEPKDNPAELKRLQDRYPQAQIWYGTRTRTYCALVRTAGADELMEDPSATGMDRKLREREEAARSAAAAAGRARIAVLPETPVHGFPRVDGPRGGYPPRNAP